MGNGFRTILVLGMMAGCSASLAGSGVTINVGLGYGNTYGYASKHQVRGSYGRYHGSNYGGYRFGYRHHGYRYGNRYGYGHEYGHGYGHGYRYQNFHYRVKGNYGYPYPKHHGYRYPGSSHSTVFVFGGTPSHGDSTQTNRYYYRDQDLYYGGSRPVYKTTSDTKPRIKLLKDRNGDCFEIRENNQGEDIYVIQDPSRCEW